MDVEVWGIDLRHSRRPDFAWRLGSHHAEKRQSLCSRAELECAAARPSADHGESDRSPFHDRRRTGGNNAKQQWPCLETSTIEGSGNRPRYRLDSSALMAVTEQRARPPRASTSYSSPF